VPEIQHPAKRQKLQQETGPLCKLLKPFVVNYWNIVLDSLTGELGFDGYIDYCSRKKNIDYTGFTSRCKPLSNKPTFTILEP
jgi:hypothetical protein